jgi:cytochrome P450
LLGVADATPGLATMDVNRPVECRGSGRTPCANRAPGPGGQRWTGHSAAFNRDPIGFLIYCARTYGDVVSLRFGGERVLVLNHPSYIEQVMVTDKANFTKAFKREYQPILGKGLFMSEGAFWLRQRRLLEPAFRRQRLALHGEAIVAITERLVGTWRDGETRDFHKEMMQLLLEISAKTICGSDDVEEAREIGEALAEVNRCIEAGFGRPWYMPAWLPDARNRRLRKATRRLDKHVYGLIERRRAAPDAGNDALSMLVCSAHETSGGATSDRQLRDELLNLLQAGRETTALALTWSWLLLARHPAILNALQAELEGCLPAASATIADLPRLRMAEAILMESMRLFPPAAVLKRKAVRDCEIGGYSVRRGTSIMLPIFVVHRDLRFFTDSDKFQPARWTDGQTSSLPGFAYFPFGGGPRRCIGATLAMMTGVLVLATIARRFDVRCSARHTVALWPAVTLRPCNGVHLVIKERARVPAGVE